MKTQNNKFKNSHDFKKRKFESSTIMKKYPDRIPVVVQRTEDSKSIPKIDKAKYLVPTDLTVGQFVYIIRRRIKLDPQTAIFIFVNNSLPPTAEILSNLYEKEKDKDGFLYIFYSSENTFG